MKNDNTKIIAILLFLAFVIGICWYFSTLIIYLFIALLLSMAGSPIVKLLCKLRIGKLSFPRSLAAVIALAVILGIIYGFFALITPLVQQEINTISNTDPQIIVDGYNQLLINFEHWAAQHGFYITSSELSATLESQLRDFIYKLDFGYIFKDLAGVIASLSVAVFSIIFLTYFSLSDNGIIIKTIKKIFPINWRTNFDHIVVNTRQQVVRYFGGVVLEMLIVGTINGFVCYLLGVPNAVLIGVISGLFNIIPYIGPLCAAIISIVISCTALIPLSPTSTDLLINVIKVGCTFLGCKMIDDFVLQPVIYGKSVQAHPIEIFIVILAAAQIGGILGMIFAVPAYSLIRIVIKEFFGQYFEEKDEQEANENAIDIN